LVVAGVQAQQMLELLAPRAASKGLAVIEKLRAEFRKGNARRRFTQKEQRFDKRNQVVGSRGGIPEITQRRLGFAQGREQRLLPRE